MSDAASAAAQRCKGGAELTEGKMGFSPDDYECGFDEKVSTGKMRKGNVRLPRLKDIARIESGFLLLSNIKIVGILDTDTMNRTSRVKIRAVDCGLLSANATICTYEADRCLETETDADRDGWCMRQSRFLRPSDLSPLTPSSDGWTIDRASAAD